MTVGISPLRTVKKIPEYIEREALLNAVENAMDDCEYYGEWEDCISEYNNDIFDVIKKAPVTDAQKVVRCKDCKYFSKDTFGQSVCTRLFNHFCMNPDDFCSYGERKCGNGNG